MKSKVENILHLLIIIFIIAGGLILLSNSKLKIKNPLTLNQNLQASPSFQQSSTQRVNELKTQITKTDKAFGDLTLVDQAEFKIDYLIASDSFTVIIKKNPFVDSKKKAQDWFLNKGFQKADLCQLQIEFVATKEVKFQIKPTDKIPDGCALPNSSPQASPEATP